MMKRQKDKETNGFIILQLEEIDNHGYKGQARRMASDE